MSGRRVNFNLRKMMSNLVKPHRLKTQYEVLKFSPILGPQELEFSQVELRSSGLPTSRSCTKEADTWPCVPFKLSICAGAGHLLVLRLSEGQMSDFKGAAPMVKPFRTHKPCSAMKNTMPTGSAMRCRTAALLHASRESPTEKCKLHSTGHSTKAAIKSEPCSASLKTGDLFTPPPAHAPTLSFQQS